MRTFDLAIIGAGIVGAAAAYLAGKARPEWRVLLLDRSLIGDGATRYSAALDLPFARCPAQKKLVEDSVRFYQTLKLEHPEIPLHDIRATVVVRAVDAQRVKDSFVDRLRPASYERGEFQHICYKPAVPQDYVVLATDNARHGRASEITSALVRHACKNHHVECWQGTEVAGVLQGRDSLQLVCADGRTVWAQRILGATGPWMTTGPLAGLSRAYGVRIKKVAALHIDVPVPPGAPVIYFAQEDAFLLPVHEENQLIFSFTSAEWDCSPEISQLKISAADRALATSVLDRYCPGLMARCHGGRVFCDAYNKDRVPFAVPVPGMKNFVAAGACSGSGFRLAPGVARQALTLLGVTETVPDGGLVYEKSTCAGTSAHTEW